MSVLPDWMIKRDIGITPLEENVKREGKISYGVGSYGLDIRLGYKFKVFSPINAMEIDPKNFDPKSLVEIDLTPDEHDWEKNPYELTENGNNTVHICTKCGIWTNHPERKTNCGDKPNYIRIPPHSFVLAESFETFKIPRDVLCIVVGKSTYARCGLIVNVTPLEPEWEGKLTIEISNTTPLPVRIYAAEGIAQCIFLRTDGHNEACKRAISDILSDRDDEGVIDPSQIHSNFMRNIANGTCAVSYADKKGKYQAQVGLTLPKVDEKV